MTTYWLVLLLIGIVLVTVFIGVKSGCDEHKKRQRLNDLWQKVCLLTPDNKPLLVYNELQIRTLAITTFGKLRDRGVERITIKTSGGEKILINGTCSILKVDGQEDLIQVLFERITSWPKPSVGSENLNEWELWHEAMRRMFRQCEDLYVQLGTKIPRGVLRADIERLNTRCYEPIEVWEALYPDIVKSIQSRTQSR